MRTSFVKTLINKAKEDESIFLICGDLGFSVLEEFREKFPRRFLNVGIAEQNMVGVAAGLAMNGFKVFIYSIGNFSSLRALEQIRYDVCYHGLDVNIVSVGAGFAYGPLGCSHHATEDFGIMRTLPSVTIYNPCDPAEVEYCLGRVFDSNMPSYIRLGKSGEKKIFELDEITLGVINKIIVGKKILFLATGSICGALEEYIKSRELSVSLYSVCVISEEVKEELLTKLEKYKVIFTFEEHQLNNGFGTFVVEALVDGLASGKINSMPRIVRNGIKNKFFSAAGSQDYIRKNEILSDDLILKKINEHLEEI